MSSRVSSNYQSFLARTSPLVPVRYHAQPSGASSSSTVASGAEAKEVIRPHIVLRDIWSAYEELSCFGTEVPLSLEGIDEEVTSYYAPTLSAMQIFTIKPFADGCGSSSGSSSVGTDDGLGYLYFQYNELEKPHERHPLTAKIELLAEQHSGLHSLTSSDLSPDSWLSIAWYPIYQIPSVKCMKKELSAAFLTYHKLKPDFPETFVEDDKKLKEHGKSSKEVVLPPSGAMTYKASGNVWNMPRTSDHDDRDRHEKAASSWVEKLGFTHSDYKFFFKCNIYYHSW
ncbi:hypothetical protein Rs2_45975 [Raphanus sativus]|uniref:Uncharacterized protein LOC130501983 n=1 Tax=Raphanus sativus TaxID=3726 RepID=A0A9W3CMR2_RAPSA|nr:uncharacterized protein LOC130501983 [Raphanus sativus]KAJ4872348.1 hypothetical protein Rs2_45975 [Raphanus sativus]